MSVTEPAANADVQFQALLNLHTQANWQELVDAAAAFLNRGNLKARQRAMVKHLQADGLRQLGQKPEADQVLGEAVGLACTPQAALQWLEHQWELERPAERGWAAVVQHLVRRGHAPAVLRTLMGALARLPLQGQREALLAQIERSDALLLGLEPTLARQWRWLKQAAPGRGTQFWA